jgi:hypothetical protein
MLSKFGITIIALSALVATPCLAGGEEPYQLSKLDWLELRLNNCSAVTNSSTELKLGVTQHYMPTVGGGWINKSDTLFVNASLYPSMTEVSATGQDKSALHSSSKLLAERVLANCVEAIKTTANLKKWTWLKVEVIKYGPGWK